MDSDPPAPAFLAWRRLLGALGAAAAVDVALSVVVVAIEAAGPTECYRRWVPAVGRAETAAMVLVVASIGLVAWLLARGAGSLRAVPSKLSAGQALVLLAGTTLLVGGCEAVCVLARGVFDRSYQSSAAGPDGRTAHLYRGGFWSCSYVVYVAERGAMTMTQAELVERDACDGDYSVRWEGDATVRIVDARGDRIRAQPNTLFPQKKLCPVPASARPPTPE